MGITIEVNDTHPENKSEIETTFGREVGRVTEVKAEHPPKAPDKLIQLFMVWQNVRSVKLLQLRNKDPT